MHFPAWAYEDGAMKPLVTHVHVIPLEDRPGLLHCAQQNCWCFPSIDAEDSRLLTHNAITSASEGWIKIAENRQHSHSGAQPAPVSERWPEFSDCDNAERVWCWSWAIGTWRLSRINRSIHTHWLPANALPLPS